MTLKETLSEDMKTAMRAKDSEKLATIRLINAAIKQRKDSITQFEAGGRQDLADKEKSEITVLAAYMPAQMSEAEVQAEVATAVTQAGASGPQDMGKVMAVLKPKLAGRADMTAVSALVKAALTK